MSNRRFLQDRGLILRQAIFAWAALTAGVLVFVGVALFLSLFMAEREHIVIFAFLLVAPILLVIHLTFYRRNYLFAIPKPLTIMGNRKRRGLASQPERESQDQGFEDSLAKRRHHFFDKTAPKDFIMNVTVRLNDGSEHDVFTEAIVLSFNTGFGTLKIDLRNIVSMRNIERFVALRNDLYKNKFEIESTDGSKIIGVPKSPSKLRFQYSETTDTDIEIKLGEIDWLKATPVFRYAETGALRAALNPTNF